jgi:cell division protein FtsQ
MTRRTIETPAAGGRRSLNGLLRAATAAAVMLAAAVGAIAAFHRTEAFLTGNPRFVLSGPGEDGQESPSVRLHGVEHAPRARLLAVFDRDYGRSIYLVPLEERRRQLLAVEWIRDASVRRTWPDRLDVYLAERQPVAFVAVPAAQAGVSRLALIDEDGVILEPPARAEYHLPVLAGIRPDQGLAARRDGVRRMLRLVAEAGPLAENVSEIDVSDRQNLKLVEQVDGRALTLLVGSRDFRRRLEKFHANYPQIRGQLGEAATLDLRIDKSIIAVPGADRAR